MSDRLRVGKIEIDKEGISIGDKRHVSHATPEKKPVKSSNTSLDMIPDRPLLIAAPVLAVLGVVLLLGASSVFSLQWLAGMFLAGAGVGAGALVGVKTLQKKLAASKLNAELAQKVDECKGAILKLLKKEEEPQARSWIADKLKRYELEVVTASLQGLLATQQIVEDVDLETGTFTYTPAEDVRDALDHVPLNEFEKRLQKGDGK